MDEMTETVNANISTAWEKIDKMVDGFYGLLPNLVIAAVVFGIFFLLGKLLQRGTNHWTRDRQSKNIGILLGRIGMWAVLLLGLMVAVSIVAPSVGPAEFFGVLGISSVAIGFAFKDILQNFLAGILILLREPFKEGDAIQYGDFSGTVESIETRSTFIQTWDGSRVIIPNGTLFTNSIEVITAHPNRRKGIDVGIGYGENIEQALAIILAAIKSVPGVLQEPAPFVHTDNLSESSVNLKAFWWSKNEDFGGVASQVITRIKERLDEKHIQIPYPTRTLLMSEGDRNSLSEIPTRMSG